MPIIPPALQSSAEETGTRRGCGFGDLCAAGINMGKCLPLPAGSQGFTSTLSRYLLSRSGALGNEASNLRLKNARACAGASVVNEGLEYGKPTLRKNTLTWKFAHSLSFASMDFRCRLS